MYRPWSTVDLVSCNLVATTWGRVPRASRGANPEACILRGYTETKKRSPRILSLSYGVPKKPILNHPIDKLLAQLYIPILESIQVCVFA